MKSTSSATASRSSTAAGSSPSARPSELKARVGPDATLDDVFIRLVAATSETETEGSYGDVRRARRAAREHG